MLKKILTFFIIKYKETKNVEKGKKNMRSKRLSRIVKVIILIVIAMSVQVVNSRVLASTIKVAGAAADKVNELQNQKKDTGSVDDILNAGSNWINGAEKTDGTSVDDFVDNFIGVGQVLVTIGIVTVLIVALIMAFKWITATPDKQAKLKEQLIGLVVAVVVIFGAVGIWRLVRGIIGNIESQNLGIVEESGTSERIYEKAKALENWKI